MMTKGMCVAVALWTAFAARAEVMVSNLFSDNMVLQRDIPAPVWGTADPGEKVAVSLGEAVASAVADDKGRWMARLPAMRADATPRDMRIRGTNTIDIRNVLVGDVWLCSGQSNMEFGLRGCKAPEDIASADHPGIRWLKIEKRASSIPLVGGIARTWEVCTPRMAGSITAVGFYYARKIQRETGIPIGLIDNNFGGTNIISWIAPSGYEMEPSLAKYTQQIIAREAAYRAELAISLDPLEQWMPAARQALAAGQPVPPQPFLPGNLMSIGVSALYNGQIHPVLPYGIKGVIWYQGEANGHEGDEYFHEMSALIRGWRKEFGLGEFPFYYVQLANFKRPSEDPQGGDGWARIRMAQLKSLQIPNTGMAVAIDLADADNPDNIHPANKYDVGERLALWALARDYGQTSLVCSGPLYRSMKEEGGKIRIEFDHVGSGLMVGKKEGRNPTGEDKGARLKRFAIAGEDRKWAWAEAVIDGDTIVVSSPAVAKPVAVRYAYSMNPAGCNLYNREGLPASPFRTDDW